MQGTQGHTGVRGGQRLLIQSACFFGGGTWKQVLKELLGLTAGEAGELGLRGRRQSVGPGLAGAGRGELGGEKGLLNKGTGKRRVWDRLPRSGSSKTP